MDRNRNLTVVLALAAGLLGGFLTRYVALPTVHAQMEPPNVVEIKAQRFSLVDAQGHVIGTFTGSIRKSQWQGSAARVAFVDPDGRELWSADGRPFKYLTEK